MTIIKTKIFWTLKLAVFEVPETFLFRRMLPRQMSHGKMLHGQMSHGQLLPSQVLIGQVLTGFHDRGSLVVLITDLKYGNIHHIYIRERYQGFSTFFCKILFFEFKKKPPTNVFVTYGVLFRRGSPTRPNKKLSRVLPEMKKILRGGVR